MIERNLGILTETGITLSDGSLITEGLILEFAREIVRLTEVWDLDSYPALRKKMKAELSSEELRLLDGIMVPDWSKKYADEGDEEFAIVDLRVGILA